MSTDMTFAFSQLPFDIFHDVASRLDHFSLDRLAKTAKSSRRLLQTENTVKAVMQVYLRYCLWVQLALSPLEPGPGPRQTLARIVDSQSALQQASPYSVCILAYTPNFIYSMGVLCYTTSDFTLRILNFNDRRDTEQVFGREFFTGQVCIANREQATIDLESLKTMWVESYADGIVVLQCSVGVNFTRYILAVDIKKTSNPPRPRIRLCVSTKGPCTNKLFVRNNERFMVLGTNWGRETNETWFLEVYDLETSQQVNGEPLLLSDCGSRIGSTVSFTIYKDQFYAVTNQLSGEWTSYYGIITFSLRLGDPDPELTNHLIWRREHMDGPIDDTWTDLSFQIDYSTGELLVVEGRKEWGPEGGPLIRTYHTTPIRRADLVPSNEIDNSRRVPAGRYIHAEFRDDGGEKEATKEYSRKKTKWNGYSFNAQTFVDFITDDFNVKGEWLPRERTKLRVVSRQESSPLVKDAVNPEDWVLRKPKRDPEGREMEDGERAFTANTISLWPPEDAPKDLQDMLHCKCFRRQDAKAVVGDEGIFLRAGGPGPLNWSLVFICCDPTFGFQGMRRLDGSLARPKWDMKTEDDGEFDVEHPHNRGVTREPAMYGVIGRGYWVR
ncbi:hypothetical protein Z517_09307 [Fonsecaea pedrosoi CBS 271.37]|uniref:F-box domain-containing protein n=1 Tax=Fonsecaea pedrosoi CBS 271.37 TaxID=1442368 RepID=A0A0D2G848_9EURO|nr:uncharacterized protein Z517_09307 [Fonsecaea pedrosoi CBS 271.37]KIW76863.1 hypothetical protein Z517_09307 [Fonsecaea pedrosoi CBS 271.37]